MKRPWHIGFVALASLAVVFAVMGWITVRLLRAEERNRQMQREAAEASITRLALWRMDAAVSPLIIEESARPYYEYAAFNPAETVNPVAYNRTATNATLVPSPLLTQSPSNVLAYFNGSVAPGGTAPELASPQVPTGELNDWFLSNYGGATGINNVNSDNFAAFTARVSIADLREAFGNSCTTTGAVAAATVPVQVEQPLQQVQAPDVQQMAMNANDQAVRYNQSLRSQRRIQSTKQQVYAQNTIAFENVKGSRETGWDGGKPTAADASIGPWGTPAPKVDEGVMKAVWIDDKLVLGRLVKVNKERYVQGAWLNWEMLRRELLTEIADILPSARLSPVAEGDGDGGAHTMATLPVRLSPGPCATLPELSEPAFNAPLATAWACVLIATLAVGLLVAGTVSLSERRAAFVSAVTHELRTPLTTFQMYSEMLSEDMVPEEKKRHYFDVLRAEGSRLSHLVENVLSYSRIERGGGRRASERLLLSDVVARVRDRLERRAAQAEMELVCDDEATAGSAISADLSAVEQILFNLVDNACKYAARAEDRRIHLELSAAGGGVTLSVRDHGPGISVREAKRLFRPFRKSAKHAAETAPGVGLGLALSRQLARRMGGSLRIDAAATDGARFDLTLPVARD